MNQNSFEMVVGLSNFINGAWDYFFIAGVLMFALAVLIVLTKPLVVIDFFENLYGQFTDYVDVVRNR